MLDENGNLRTTLPRNVMEPPSVFELPITPVDFTFNLEPKVSLISWIPSLLEAPISKSST